MALTATMIVTLGKNTVKNMMGEKINHNDVQVTLEYNKNFEASVISWRP